MVLCFRYHHTNDLWEKNKMEKFIKFDPKIIYMNPFSVLDHGSYKKELEYFGGASGRDENKIERDQSKPVP